MITHKFQCRILYLCLVFFTVLLKLVLLEIQARFEGKFDFIRMGSSGSVLEVTGIITASQTIPRKFWLDKNHIHRLMWKSSLRCCIKGMIGPFGLLDLASEDPTERTVISLCVYRVVSRR
ncbi:unnamed protein product [Vicia faba]|uniref:Uncharacterized protein n=1 Tax=Vicia faba TaxID=3906 RepID=A0AAV1A9C0_VICFA|nr:unnamed protein product [Vicia faba]